MPDTLNQFESLLAVVRAAQCLTVMKPPKDAREPVLIGAVGWNQLQNAIAQLLESGK